MPDQPTVRPGQVWADNDPRSEGRTLKVLSVQNGGAECEILTNRTSVQEELDRGATWAGKDMRGQTTTISVSRFRPTSSGYRLVEDAPAESAP